MLKLASSIVGSIGVLLALSGLLLVSLGSYVAWGFPWELLSHFRVQYFVASVLLCLASLALWRVGWLRPKALLLLAFVLVGLNAVEVVPWYLPHSQQISKVAIKQAALTSVRILVANVNGNNDRYAPTIQMVRDEKPDVALFIEMNPDWVNELNAGLSDLLPYRLPGQSGGLLLMSRQPLSQVQVNPPLDASLPTLLQIGGKPVQFIGTHPIVPVRRTLFHRRNQQLDKLSRYVKTLDAPTIVIGDFNLTPWSPYYRRFIQQTRLHNASLGFGVLPTYPSPSTLVKTPKWLIPLVRIPIDHCLVSKQVRVSTLRTISHGNADHAAVVAELVLR
ncbi:endonuclease/exonuclease/phosphatase family protein [Leptolyngbya sp. FACHB-36]|uniref:endonuclease/exonuclease/phosphatase family protein n=1 Tax=Leptolyngbya sp. FACHB-36 TaxID=2692808 RepID=UPI001680AF3E|nr:endonuclease/exonuclease/phosphatase family protein [Leptolyngbya sp. FACHB-36]MBD2020149.1 endonuclease/exonuclease/phosphatase family protein [Leptolyngbya sp. FACHB-36]